MLKSEFTQPQLLNFFCRNLIILSGRYVGKKAGVFLIETHCIYLGLIVPI